MTDQDNRPDLSELSDKAIHTLLCAARHVRETGRFPTVRRLARQRGLASPSGPSYHLDCLEKAGLIGRDDRGRRVIVGTVQVAAFPPWLETMLREEDDMTAEAATDLEEEWDE